MPEVWIKALVEGSEIDLLMNSGARDLELVVPSRLAKKLGIKLPDETEVLFGGTKYRAEVGKAKVSVRNPKTDEERVSEVEVVSLPDEALDQPLLGVLGHEKLRIIPNTITGEAIFE